MVVDSTGKITSTQRSVQNGIITEPTSSWEYQIGPADKSLVEQESTTADILYRGDVTLSEGAVPCTGASNLVFHATLKSGKENQFVESGEVRCIPFNLIPEAVNTLHSTIDCWSRVYAVN